MALFASGDTPAPPSDLSTWVVQTPQDLARLADQLATAPVIAIDTETTSTDAVTAALVGISLAIEPDRGIYIPVGHRLDMAQGTQVELSAALQALRPAMTDPTIAKVGHNLKYDYTVLARYGLAPEPLAFDTMLAEWLCDPASRNLGLKSLAWVRLGRKSGD